MRVIRIPGGDLPAAARCLALGNFDGVHAGHRDLLAACAAAARAAGLRASALTFQPHPRAVVNGGHPSALTPAAEKARLIRELALDELLFMRFTPELAARAPDAFVREVVAGALSARLVFVGWNFAFGRRGAGGPEDLERLGAELGFSVRVLPPVAIDGHAVSSSKVRLLLSAGSVDVAERFLGRPYALEGRVVHGNGLGRGLGFPTANLAPRCAAGKALPAAGVYACLADLAGRLLPAVVNVGTRPTIGAALPVTVEAHLLDFAADLYGTTLRLLFKKRLRDEVKFGNLGELRDEIAADCGRARRFFGGLDGGGH